LALVTRYSDYVDRAEGVAVLGATANGQTHANAEGRTLLQHQADAFRDAFREAGEAGVVVNRQIGGRTLAFVPLFAEEGLDGVLATSADARELPRLLHQLHSPMRHFAEIVHLLAHIVLTARPSGRIDYASRRWSEVIPGGLDRSELHDNVFNAVVEEDRPMFARGWQAGIASGEEFDFDVRLTTLAGPRWYALRAIPWRVGGGAMIKWAISLIDVDEGVRAHAALERAQRRAALLADVGRILNAATSPVEIARDIVLLLAGWCGGRAIVELRDLEKRVAAAAEPSDSHVLMPSIAAALARRTPLAQIGVPGLRAVALSGRGRASGFIAATLEPHSDEEQDDLLMRDLAERTTTALENVLARRREHDIATGLQRAMLPVVLPRIPGVAFDVAYATADGDMLVGGDWYDAFLLRDGRIGIAIGDVAGNGLDAAVVMANVRRTMRSAALDRCGPAGTLALANVVAWLEECPMVTAFFGILDPLTHELEYACAGHPPPISVDANGGLVALVLDGPPLGVNEQTRLQTRKIELPNDSALVLYTDGVLEAGHDLLRGEHTMYDTLRDWAVRGFAESAETLQERIVGSAVRADDAAMLIVRLAPVDELELAFPATLADSHRARIAVQRYARQSPLGERAADFALAMAEAMNNAAEHAYVGPPGMVRVRVRIAAGRAIGVVEDDGRWREQRSTDRGRGIAMIRALTDECDVTHSERGTKVTLVMRLPARQAARDSA
jgi:anti-sigma regulatory factor (Ser/Thr protein kinase)/PAS domain-containing protein